MDLQQPIDAYCERLAPGFWAEPWNAVTNAAFLMAAAWALVLWRRQANRQGHKDFYALVLIGILAAIGTGSFLFHTLAVRWSAFADVIPIALFIHAYVLIALRRFLGLAWWQAGLGLVAFMVLTPLIVWAASPIVGSSASYAPALLALFGVGGLALHRDRQAGRTLLGVGLLFAVSLTCRMLDDPMCTIWPLGTHFVWHIFNAIVLFLLLRLLICRKPGYTHGTV